MTNYEKRERAGAGKKHQLKKGLAPIIDKDTKVLILGSFPGDDSLKLQEYYANPRNQFWRILSELLKEKDLPRYQYSEKKGFLLKNGIGLWDVIASCQREGSSDNRIRNEKFNDFNELFQKYPKGIKVFCNGKKAYGLFSKNCQAKVDFVCLPSSSPANAVLFNQKKKKWSIAIDSL